MNLRALSVLTGLSVATAYLYAMGPTFFWLDSSELVAAGWGLGISHPPGHPLHGLLTRLFCLLPFGTLAFRASLGSGAAAAVAAGLMVALCHHVVRRVLAPRGALERRLTALASVSAGLTLGLSYALWLQAVRAEVYALNLVLLVAAVYLAVLWDERGDARLLVVAALLLGLGLCNHHFLVLLCLPGLVCFWLTRRGALARWRRDVAAVAAAGLVALLTLAYLPLRASQAPMVNWGAPTTASRLAWVVSAEAFQNKSLERAAAETLSHRWLGGLFTIFRGIAWDSLLGLALGLLALAGVYLLLRRRGARRLGLLFLALATFNVLSPVLVGLDPYNPDAYGYLCVAVAFLCPPLAVTFCTLLFALVRRVQARGARWLAVAAGAACLGVGVGQVARNLPRVDLQTHWEAEESGRQLLRDLPPGALAFSSYFETVFNLWALRSMADLRPDIDLVHRNFLAYPGTVEHIEGRLPHLAGAARRFRDAGHLLPAELERLAAARPVHVEYDLNLSPAVARRLSPHGLVLAFGPREPEGRAPSRRKDAGEHIRRIQRWDRLLAARVLGGAAAGETRRAAVWTHYLLARYGCQQGLTSLTRFHLARARALAPQDRTLLQLSRRCGPLSPRWRTPRRVW